LEGSSAAADFAVDDVVFVAGAGGDGAGEGVLADVVDYAGDFADLREMVSDVLCQGKGEQRTSGMVARV